MEPVTHFLTGACLSRTGFNRKAAYATLAMTLAAEMPDLDVIWSRLGPITGFQHHRGITHTFVAIPFEAGVVVGAVWLLHRWRLKRGGSTAAPVRWGLLWAFSMIALLSHILLDWTNNYGVRPFFPFNAHWYAGSFVFIFEPVIFLLLLAGLVAPALFGLINSEVGERKRPFQGRGWAIFALSSIVLVWGYRFVERAGAMRMAQRQDYTADGTSSATVIRTFASPFPIDPFKWSVIVETPHYYQLVSVDTRLHTADSSGQADVFYKPAETPDTLAAKQSLGGRVFLDWSMFPLVNDAGPDPENPGLKLITFRDLRFMYNTSFFRGRERTPLGMEVLVDSSHHVVSQQMDGKEQR